MDDLSGHIDFLRTKYRTVFLEIAKNIEVDVLKLKPKDLDGEIFDIYEENSIGSKWQKDAFLMIKDKYFKKLADYKAKINDIRKNYSCVGCGACCRLACSEFSYDELKSKANNGDNFASQFIKTFVPYKSVEEVEKLFPEYLKLLKDQKETGYYFYHCPKVTDDNRCPDYENRPQICRDFPDNPVGFLPLSCGFMDWKLKSEEVSLKLNAMYEIVNFYIQHLKNCTNNFSM